MIGSGLQFVQEEDDIQQELLCINCILITTVYVCRERECV